MRLPSHQEKFSYNAGKIGTVQETVRNKQVKGSKSWRKLEEGKIAFPAKVVTEDVTDAVRFVLEWRVVWRHIKGLGGRGQGAVQKNGKQQKESRSLSCHVG